MASPIDLRMSLVPNRVYRVIKAWDLFPPLNGSSSLNNQIGQPIQMPATCNRTRVYIAAMLIGNGAVSLLNKIGNLDAVLKGFDSQDQLVAEIPIGVHIVQVGSNNTTPKILALPTGYSEVRLFNRANSGGPVVFSQQTVRYGWSARGGEMVNLDSSGSGSAGNAGVSDAKDNLVLAGNLDAEGALVSGFAVTVAPWTIEAPVAKWSLDGNWSDFTTGINNGYSASIAHYMAIYGLFVGEQV